MQADLQGLGDLVAGHVVEPGHEGPLLLGHRCPLRARPWTRAVELATHLDLGMPRQPGLSASGGELLRIFEARQLSGLRSIRLGQNIPNARQRAQIAARPTRESLRHLAVSGLDARSAPFVTGPCFAAVEHLDVRDGRLEAGDVAMLLDAPSLSRLSKLDLARNPIGDDGLARLASSPCLTGELAQTKVTDAGMPHLARAERLRAIESLSLVDNRIGASGLSSLMSSEGLEAVRVLDLTRCVIGDEGARAIAEAPHLNLVRARRHSAEAPGPGLLLRGGRIAARGLDALSHAGWFGELEDLDLGYCDLDDAALRAMHRLRSARLRRLGLDGNPITAHGLGHLLASPVGSQLEELTLHGCVELGARGAAAIARAPTSASLRVLNVQNCKLGAEGARELASSRYLGGLRELWIWSGDILRDGDGYSEGAREMLQAAFPNAEVIG